ncbi:MAG: uroporphyrinogen decarboxylase family protein [Kiritimatiellae bacterium]|nr:uroporphyrinogen decarboxylase family protein [Kiritimatiellia bacterium]
MTPRERVLCVIRHERPDRTPRDFWAEKPALNRLFATLGHQDEERLLQQLQIDIRHLNAKTPDEVEISPGTFQNFWGERYVYKSTPWGPMREDSKGALANADSLAELETFPYPNPDMFDYSELAKQCRQCELYASLYGFADIWQRPALVRGWEAWLMDMVDRPEMVHFLSRKFTDFYLEDYTRAAEVSKGRIDLYLLISDLGTQRGPLISPAMFKEFVAPYIKEMVDYIHGLGGKALYHSCGLIHEFIPELISLGVDVLDPIQPVGPLMSPERLKADFGGRICFHGGIDMQTILTLGTPEQVRHEVERYCETFSKGDYILGPAHLFQPDVPPENILAVYDRN